MKTALRLKREKQKETLKKRRDELLEELELSKQKFREKLPNVHGKGKDFEICAKKCKWCKTTKTMLGGRGGAKPSLLQQVIYLEELTASTRELRQRIHEAMEAEKNKEEESKTPKEGEE